MESALQVRVDYFEADGSLSFWDYADVPLNAVGPHPYVFVEDDDLRYHTPPQGGRLELYWEAR
jgi:hypothetical protein